MMKMIKRVAQAPRIKIHDKPTLVQNKSILQAYPVKVKGEKEKKKGGSSFNCLSNALWIRS
jgi:hypothetical protein